MERLQGRQRGERPGLTKLLRWTLKYRELDAAARAVVEKRYRKGKPTPILDEKPGPLPVWLEPIWEAWWMLHHARPIAAGMAVIECGLPPAWFPPTAQIFGITDHLEFARLIHRLDLEYLAFRADKREEEEKKRKRGKPTLPK